MENWTFLLEQLHCVVLSKLVAHADPAQLCLHADAFGDFDVDDDV